MNRVCDIYVTGSRRQITDLDSLPFPDRSLIDYEKYNRYITDAMVKHSISLLATRGCPFRCTYCHKIWPKKHFVRSAENVFEEVRLYYNMGVRRFTFVDDIFNLDIKNSTRFFQLMIKNGLNKDAHLFFANGVRGDILTKDYIDLMIEAGTVNIALALETASPRLQKLIKKNLNIEKLRGNLDYICQKYPQVITNLFTMIGFPTETEEEAMMTLDFIKSIRWIHFATPAILIIYPNTEMAELAVENGISPAVIEKSANLAYHELPETLPFAKGFAFHFKFKYLHEYFLTRERLLAVLPHQKKILTEKEMVQKYSSYMSGSGINSFIQLLKLFGITENKSDQGYFVDENRVRIPGLNEKMENYFPQKKADENALKILLLDLSQSFSWESDQLADLVEPPLGLMYLLTYLNRRFESQIRGKIAKSLVDFDSYPKLKALIEEFKPDILGIRTLSFFRNLFHNTVKKIRQWGFSMPIIVGGPYATSTYETILQDENIHLVVLGEGEITFAEVIEKVIENGGKLPDEETLKEIAGVAFVPERIESKQTFTQVENAGNARVEVLFEDERKEILFQFNDDLENE